MTQTVNLPDLLPAFLTDVNQRIATAEATLAQLRAERTAALALESAVNGTPVTVTASPKSSSSRKRTSVEGKNGPGPIRQRLLAAGVKISARGRISEAHMAQYQELVEADLAKANTQTAAGNGTVGDNLAAAAKAAAEAAQKGLTEAGELPASGDDSAMILTPDPPAAAPQAPNPPARRPRRTTATTGKSTSGKTRGSKAA